MLSLMRLIGTLLDDTPHKWLPYRRTKRPPLTEERKKRLRKLRKQRFWFDFWFTCCFLVLVAGYVVLRLMNGQ